jgi:RNA polymerase sigma factor (sigma-70 family)
MSIDKVTDYALLKKCIDDNDKAAWEVFVRNYSKLIWNSIHKTFLRYSFQYSNEDVEDMYSSIFLSLVENDFNKLRQFRSKDACSISTWLSIISVRMTIDFLRKDKSHLITESSSDDHDIWNLLSDNKYRSDKLLEQKQANEILKESIALLSPKDKMIYDLLYNRGGSPEDTAKTLGLPTSMIYSRKHRIIEKIKKNIGRM